MEEEEEPVTSKDNAILVTFSLALDVMKILWNLTRIQTKLIEAGVNVGLVPCIPQVIP